MYRCRLCLLFVVTFCCPLQAENSLRIQDGSLWLWGRHFDTWGVELKAEQVTTVDFVALAGAIQPWCEQGISTIGFSLQPWGESASLFAPDGRIADARAGQRFTRLVQFIRDHHLGAMVSLFSTDRRYRLESPEAYRKATQEVTRLLPEKHSTIFIVGNAFRDEAPSADCPDLLCDPAKAIELCRSIHETNREALVGFPGFMVPTATAGGGRRSRAHFAPSADVLQALLTDTPSADLVAIRPECLLARDEVMREPCLQDYLARVAKARLAIQAPAVAASGPAPSESISPGEGAEGFVPIFDGRSLDGWTTLLPVWEGWSVQDGSIHCDGRNGTFLRSRKRYGSFVLRLQFRISDGGNSGVFVWSPLEGRSSRFGMEIQIRGRRAAVLDDDTTGAVYDVLPPREDASRPAGEWNDLEIACRGSKVTVRVNDRLVQDFDADQVERLRGRLRRGVIGLQDHGNKVWFRHIRIHELP